MADALSALLPLNVTLIAPLKEEVDPETCQLLGGFALAVQAAMGAIVVGSLLVKRAREKPRRRWRVWMGDIGKQIIGQAFVHASNVAISDLIARHKSDNPCSLYALNIAVDTTIGVGILYFFLKLATYYLLRIQPDDFRTGYYGDPPSLWIWAKQAAVYCVCLSLMKVVVVLLFWVIPGLFSFANWCLSWLSSDEAQVLFVMLIFPVVMNVVQFLIIDSILKSKTLSTDFAGSEYDEEARRGFLDDGDHGSDNEDGSPFKRRGSIGQPPSSSTPRSVHSEDKNRSSSPSPSRSFAQHQSESIPSGSLTPLDSRVNTSHSYPPRLKQASASSLNKTSVQATKPPPSTRTVEPAIAKHFIEPEEEESEKSGRSSFEDDWGISDPSLGSDDGGNSLDLDRQIDEILQSPASRQGDVEKIPLPLDPTHLLRAA